MIEIQTNDYEINVRGHACAGKKGEDIVCCAVSTIINLAAANVEQMLKTGLIKDCTVRILEGEAEIKIEPATETKSIVKLIFQAIQIGLIQAAATYPKNIKIKVG